MQLINLELFHHYSTVTYATLVATPSEHSLWQLYAPKLGLSHVFLLRSLLAVSALHLSRLRLPESITYLDIAAKHHESALQEFHSILDHISRSNCEASFLCSTFLVIYAFAVQRLDAAENVGIHDLGSISDWIFLIRGVHAIVVPFREVLEDSELRPLLRTRRRWISDAQYQIPEIFALWSECVTVRNGRDHDAAAAYSHALEELYSIFAEAQLTASSDENPDLGLIMVWPIILSQKFMSLLRIRTPEALVILAYYAVLLHRRDDIWWLKGWGLYMITVISEQLGEEWQLWLVWPKAKVLDAI